MTTRETNWPEGTPCWVDLGVDDFDRAQRFYGELMGWEMERGAPEFGGYASVTKDGRNVAGIAPKMDPAQPTVWTTYLASDDIEATMAKVRDNGGRVVAEPMAIADMGTMALAVDPGGAFVGFWQGGTHTGFELANEPGSVTWNEQLSRSFEESKAFYSAVVGCEYDDMSGEGFVYAAFRVGGDTAGGIGGIGAEMPEGMPAHWSTYFKVADTDDAVSGVERLGGRVIRPAWDTEFGRMAAVADDQGAVFMVMADQRG